MSLWKQSKLVYIRMSNVQFGSKSLPRNFEYCVLRVVLDCLCSLKFIAKVLILSNTVVGTRFFFALVREVLLMESEALYKGTNGNICNLFQLWENSRQRQFTVWMKIITRTYSWCTVILYLQINTIIFLFYLFFSYPSFL